MLPHTHTHTVSICIHAHTYVWAHMTSVCVYVCAYECENAHVYGYNMLVYWLDLD